MIDVICGASADLAVISRVSNLSAGCSGVRAWGIGAGGHCSDNQPAALTPSDKQRLLSNSLNNHISMLCRRSGLL